MKLHRAHWLVSSNCNLNCEFCYKPFVLENGEVGPRDWVIDRLAEVGVRQITFTGGEPTLAKDLLQLLRRTKEMKLSSVLHTNGTLLTRSHLVEYSQYLNNLSLAIDGSSSGVADLMRGIHGYFAKAFDNIQHANELGIRISIKTVVTKLNIKDIIPLGEILSKSVFRGKKGLWYLSEFTSKNVNIDNKDKYQLEDGSFEMLIDRLQQEFPQLIIWGRSRAKIDSIPYFYISPKGDVLMDDETTPGYKVIGNLRQISPMLLWAKILDSKGI